MPRLFLHAEARVKLLRSYLLSDILEMLVRHGYAVEVGALQAGEVDFMAALLSRGACSPCARCRCISLGARWGALLVK